MKVSLDWNGRGTLVTARVNHLGFVFESSEQENEKTALMDLVAVIATQYTNLWSSDA